MVTDKSSYYPDTRAITNQIQYYKRIDSAVLNGLKFGTSRANAITGMNHASFIIKVILYEKNNLDVLEA